MTIERALSGIVKGPAGTYVEDVFSTKLYTGTGATQTITNNIDLSTKGGLVWIKSRSNAYNNNWFDTIRGATYWMHSNTTAASTDDANSLTAFTTSGFTVGSGSTSGSEVNNNTNTFVSWSFRKQAKFFDIVTYTGNGSSQAIAHNLGSVPGMIIVKRTGGSADWIAYHRSLSSPQSAWVYFSYTDAASLGDTDTWNNTAPTSTNFNVGAVGRVNTNGASYIAYLFAHDAGGFGSSTTDSVIYCGSYTGNGSSTGPTVTIGWEPQFIMIKNSSSTSDWIIFDNQRGMTTGSDPCLFANLSNAESTANGDLIETSSTGFSIKSTNSEVNTNTNTYIYLAIRKNMK